MAKTLSIVFAGDGDTTFESVKALINDFVGVTGEDEEGYPEWDDTTDVELTYALTGKPTDGWKAAYDWSGYAGLNFNLVTGPDASDFDKYGDEAEKLVAVDNVGERVVSILNRAKSQNKQPYLFVLWGDEDAENPELEDILAQVLEAELPALDLTAGLDEISFRDADEVGVEEVQADTDEPGRDENVQPRPATEELQESEEELTEELIVDTFSTRARLEFPEEPGPDEAQTLIVQTTYPKGEKPVDKPSGMKPMQTAQGVSQMSAPKASDFAKAFEGLAILFRWQADYEEWVKQAEWDRLEAAAKAKAGLDADLGAPLTAAEVAPPEAAPKRGRGRPKKVDNASETATEAPKRGRGRPRKATP